MGKIWIIIFFIVASNVAFAQPYKTVKIFKPYNWMFGIHWNIVEDNGDKFGKLFDVSNSWNYLPYPSKITVDKYFKYGWSMELATAYNKYESSKIINLQTGVESHFFSFDVNGKYSFYTKYYPRAKWIDPYLTFGLGYTYRNANVAVHTPTLNLGLGLNIWIKNFGIQFHTSGKGGLFPGFWDKDNHENYLHHSIGFVYRTVDKPYTNGYFGKRKSKWAHGSRRFKKKKGQ